MDSEVERLLLVLPTLSREVPMRRPSDDFDQLQLYRFSPCTVSDRLSVAALHPTDRYVEFSSTSAMKDGSAKVRESMC